MIVYHTLGNTDPLRLRLLRNGSPYPLADVTLAKIFVTPAYKDTPVVIDNQDITIDPDQINNPSVVFYDWQPADALIAKGMYKVKIEITKPSEFKTFPTGSDDDKLILILQ